MHKLGAVLQLQTCIKYLRFLTTKWQCILETLYWGGISVLHSDDQSNKIIVFYCLNSCWMKQLIGYFSGIWHQKSVFKNYSSYGPICTLFHCYCKKERETELHNNRGRTSRQKPTLLVFLSLIYENRFLNVIFERLLFTCDEKALEFVLLKSKFRHIANSCLQASIT